MNTDLIQKARQALERPQSFGYFGELPLFESWGLCGPSTHRDADILTQSNYAVITTDLGERFPEDTEIVRSSHWAVGWTEQLAVRVLRDLPECEPAWTGARDPRMCEDYITDAFRALLEWAEALEDYPVADEQDHSRREHEDALETLEWAYGVSAEDTPAVFSWLFDNYSYCSGEEYRQDAVNEALEALGLLECEDA
jgi:hypothetical protein